MSVGGGEFWGFIVSPIPAYFLLPECEYNVTSQLSALATIPRLPAAVSFPL